MGKRSLGATPAKSVFFILLVVLVGFSCSRNRDGNILKLGISEELETLNIWLASDANSRKVLSLIYQHLYIRDPETLKLVPWLAGSEPVYDPEALSYTVGLREVKWSDGSDLTADDVVFTIGLIKQFKVPRYISKWRFVKRVEAVDRRTVRFFSEKAQGHFSHPLPWHPHCFRKRVGAHCTRGP